MPPKVSLWLGGWNEEFLLGCMRTALRATFWRSTAAGRPVGISTVLLFAVVAAVSEAANQYLTAEGAAAFSQYGINSIIAVIAVCAAVTLLFLSQRPRGSAGAASLR